ncbi:hypothetical protein HMPREF1211_04843 [Streptomyces sp. HGB0020]|nr:hypothetical protein HMPREF1211_04843 [Streptomyces sp. HGB0020]
MWGTRAQPAHTCLCDAVPQPHAGQVVYVIGFRFRFTAFPSHSPRVGVKGIFTPDRLPKNFTQQPICMPVVNPAKGEIVGRLRRVAVRAIEHQAVRPRAQRPFSGRLQTTFLAARVEPDSPLSAPNVIVRVAVPVVRLSQLSSSAGGIFGCHGGLPFGGTAILSNYAGATEPTDCVAPEPTSVVSDQFVRVLKVATFATRHGNECHRGIPWCAARENKNGRNREQEQWAALHWTCSTGYGRPLRVCAGYRSHARGYWIADSLTGAARPHRGNPR